MISRLLTGAELRVSACACIAQSLWSIACMRVRPSKSIDDAGPDAASVTDSLYLEKRARLTATTVAVEAMLRPELSLNGMSAIK